jgi:hypothetical protein
LVESLTARLKELGVDRRGVTVLMDQLDLQIAGVRHRDRDRHLARLAAVDDLLGVFTHDEPRPDAERQPVGKGTLEITDDVTDLPDRTGQRRLHDALSFA